MEISSVGFFILVTCPLWTGWLLLLYSIYNIQQHVSIRSLIFFKLWITRITLLVWMPGRFRTKMKNMVNKSPNKRESYKVHTLNFLLLPSLPLPVHQLQPMGRPALPDLLLGLRASLKMPPSLSGGLGGIHSCCLAEYLPGWSISSRPRLLASSGSFWSFLGQSCEVYFFSFMFQCAVFP